MTGYRLRMLVFLLSSWAFVAVPVLAQDKTCPEIVQAALDATETQCSATGRNEACYGNVDLEATPQPGVEGFTFSAPGDIVPVESIDNFSLSSRVDESGVWGVALLQLQANLPDSLPGQNVMFLLFGDVDISNPVQTNVETELNPMQAFYFRSGSGDAPCETAPDSGILVQTPEGAAKINFTVNDVEITLGSTAYLQAQPGGQMTTSVVEGEATVTAGGTTVTVPAGSQVEVPLDAQGQANGTPSQPQPYDAAKMAVLPIRILPRTITIAPPIGGGDGIPLVAGDWTWTPGTPSVEGCEPASVEYMVANFTPDDVFQLPAGEFDWATFYEAAYGDSTPHNAVFTTPEANTYVLSIPIWEVSWNYEMRVIDSAHIEGEFSTVDKECLLVIPFEMVGEGAAGGIVPAAGTWQATWVPPSISCDVVSETLNSTLTWDMSYYGSFSLPEGEFSPEMLYGSIMGFDMTSKTISSTSPEPNHYIMDFSEPVGIGDVHFEVQVADPEHMAGSYTLTKSNCVFDYTFEMTRTGD